MWWNQAISVLARSSQTRHCRSDQGEIEDASDPCHSGGVWLSSLCCNLIRRMLLIYYELFQVLGWIDSFLSVIVGYVAVAVMWDTNLQNSELAKTAIKTENSSIHRS